jgi:hypothetical protein
MMRRTILGLTVVSIAWGLTGSAAAQTVDNPLYKEWAVWREGATVVIKQESSFGGMAASVAVQTTVLKKLNADKAVLETTSVIEAGGQKVTNGPFPMDLPARYPKFDYKAPPEDKAAEKPKYKETKGRETLTISGKKVDCEWVQYEFEGGTTMKTWSSDQIPGRMVKTVTTDPNTKTVSSTAVIEFKATKR